MRPGVLSVLLALFLAAGGASAQAVGTNVIALTPDFAELPQGIAFTLTLRLDFSADPTLGGGVDITWNPAAYRLEKWEPFPLGDELVYRPGTIAAGEIVDVFFVEAAGVGGPVELGRMTMRALAQGPASIDLSPNPVSGTFVSAQSQQPQPVQFVGSFVDTGPPLDGANAATAWRQIATVGEVGACPADAVTGCPLTESWKAHELFQASPGGTMPPALDPYCVYNLAGVPDAAQLAELDALLETGCLATLASDVLAVTYQGAPQIEPLLWPVLRDDFRAQAGKPAAPIGAPATGVRLAIVDTQPGGRLAAGNSRHGFTLRSMAGDLLCDGAGAGCGVEVTTTLGLPLVHCATDPNGVCTDNVAGGYMGTLTQLGAAIRAAVVEWLSLAPADRLVINLSVGWHPQYGADPVTDGPAVAAVYDALRDAVCRGAVVVAAAGNPINEPWPFPPADPLLPGRWEIFAAPGAAECTTLLESAPDPADFPATAGHYFPLLHAAAAVGSDNTRVAARRLGESRLVAFGDHAVTAADEGGGPTQVQTGTSVSSLLVAAATAAAWAQAPEVAGFAMANTVYAAASDLGRPADFASDSCPGCATGVRRVSVCEAAAHACAEHGAGTCSISCATAPQPGPPPLPVAKLQAQFIPTASVDIGELGNVFVPPPGSCGAVLVHHRSDDPPVAPCPQFQFWGLQAQPFASGQPSSQPCPVCARTRGADQVYVDIGPRFVGTLTDMTLLCGIDTYRLPLPGGLAAGDAYLITGVPASCSAPRLGYGVIEPEETETEFSVSTPLLDYFDDTDRDGIADDADNCLAVANADQRDTDGDAIGNRCDADFAVPNDCLVGFADLNAMKLAFFATPGTAGWNPDIDLDGDGAIGFADLNILKLAFLAPPGPSGRDGNLCAPAP